MGGEAAGTRSRSLAWKTKYSSGKLTRREKKKKRKKKREKEEQEDLLVVFRSLVPSFLPSFRNEHLCKSGETENAAKVARRVFASA